MMNSHIACVTEDFRPGLPEGFTRIELEEFQLLLHREKPAWLVVNGTGWEIIRSFNGKNRIGDIAAGISQKYQIDSSSALNDTKNYFTQLSDAGFIEEGQSVNEIQKTFRPKITRLHLNITEKCNLNCIHCGIMNSPPKLRNATLKTETICSIVDELSTTPGASIAISGGEPITHKNWLEVLRYSTQKLPTSLSTNATLITKPVAKTLAELKAPLQISFDGACSVFHNKVRGSGNYEKTIRAINYLLDEGMAQKITLCVTLMKSNIDRIFELVTFAEKNKIPAIRFLPVQRMGNAREEWSAISPSPEQYKKFYKKAYLDFMESTVNFSPGLQGFLLNIPNERWCSVGSMLAIRADGGIYPCTLMFHDEFLLGNIHTITLKEAIESEKLKEIRHQCSIRESKIEKCRLCDWKHFCQAGCPGSIFFDKGSIMESDDFCDVRKNLYETVIFRIAKNRNDPILKKSGDCKL